MNNVLTLDQELELSAEKTDKLVVKNSKTKAPAKTPTVREDRKTVADRLSTDANNKLNYYLKKTPQFQILDSQIAVLKGEYEVYKKNGSTENMAKTETMLKEITEKRTRIKGIFKTGKDSQNKAEKNKVDLSAAFKDSEVLKSLDKQKNDLLSLIKNNTPSYIVKNITSFRKQIEFSNKVNVNADIVEDLDDVISSTSPIVIPKTTDLEQQYYDYCGMVAEMCDVSASEIKDMSPYKIQMLLKSVIDDEEVAKNKAKLNAVKIGISQEREKISGGTNLTDLVFEIFDFSKEHDDDTEGAAPKEILASANIGLVKSIAYNIATKMGQQLRMDDAVSYGLLGLSLAINEWYSRQKLHGSALSFKGFANIYISGTIQKGLLELSGGGTISGSRMADIHTKNKQKLNDFVKNNPEFDGLNKDLLNEMLAGFDGTINPISVVNESDYTANVGGEEGDNNEIWANATVSESNTGDYVESKMEYENLIKSIKTLLDLFETKTEKKTGIKSITTKKLFDKYDRKLFMMYFGLEYKRQKVGDLNNQYTQTEMAEELQAMYAADGINKTFSQASLSGKDGRIGVMLNKIKFAMEDNPKVKAGFEYLYNYWLQNAENMNYFSNTREEIDMKFDRDELRQIYSDNEVELNRQLSDGKKLSDLFEISDTNPLDEDIARSFSGY